MARLEPARSKSTNKVIKICDWSSVDLDARDVVWRSVSDGWGRSGRGTRAGSERGTQGDQERELFLDSHGNTDGRKDAF